MKLHEIIMKTIEEQENTKNEAMKSIDLCQKYIAMADYNIAILNNILADQKETQDATDRNHDTNESGQHDHSSTVDQPTSDDNQPAQPEPLQDHKQVEHDNLKSKGNAGNKGRSRTKSLFQKSR